ncbi:MAG: type III-B CRISPR module RAMP protein Cmr1 [Candidatus Desantisbacteria bacterium]
MEKLTVTLKTVTPLFLGGAEPNERAEIRAASIKGAMRFWYRAIDPEYKINEPKIFGSTEQGQARFIIRIISQNILKGIRDEENWNRKKIAYLGFGLINKGKNTRPYIKSDNEFTIEIIFKPKIKNDERLAVEKSLWALLMFGGLGARSRKGFGSLMVTDINSTIFPLLWQFENADKLKEAIKNFWRTIPKPSGLQEYTRWSDKSRCIVVDEKKNGETALE